MKASKSRDVGNGKDHSSNRNASFKQGTPAGEGTTSTAKTPAMKVSRNEARIMAVNVAVIKKIWWP